MPVSFSSAKITAHVFTRAVYLIRINGIIFFRRAARSKGEMSKLLDNTKFKSSPIGFGEKSLGRF
ncbi:hypothetical protein [Ruminococcus albus]|uniref:hypothetical protein n=1 Tax=Ruminococcus albus TaxID=1264 RepID=UPI000941D6E9|nr:hypothetical protein [Ruminococcus albus]